VHVRTGPSELCFTIPRRQLIVRGRDIDVTVSSEKTNPAPCCDTNRRGCRITDIITYIHRCFFVCFRMQAKKKGNSARVNKETVRDIDQRNISQYPLELGINGYIKPCLPPAIVSSALNPTSSDSHTIFTSQYSVSSNICITLPLIISFTYIKTRHYSKNAVPVARLRDGFECRTRCSDECPGGSIVCASSGLPLKTFGIPS
jgi:hypothetical protein